MCYSVQSSLRTTVMSFAAIVYLLTSNIPHFQWLGVTLIGWCGMQINELLLWLTQPRKGCTKWNEWITMTLIPFTLMAQPLFALWGSLCVFPWKSLSQFRKQCMLLYTVLCVVIISFTHFYKPDKICTTVTKKGHLLWSTRTSIQSNNIVAYIWAILIVLPLFLLWNKNIMLIILLCILSIIGIQLGQYTDSQGSIWCYYTSYTSIIASVALFLKQTNIYAII